MGKVDRIFGNNIKYYLWKKNVNASEFASELGYSLFDLCRIEDARAYLEQTEKEAIANAIGLTLEEMYEEKDEAEYELAGCFECRGYFSDLNNKKLILDLFDVYCDVQEMLIDSRV